MSKTLAPITPQTLILHQDTLFIFFLSLRAGMITICVIIIIFFLVSTLFLDVLLQENQTSHSHPPVCLCAHREA